MPTETSRDRSSPMGPSCSTSSPDVMLSHWSIRFELGLCKELVMSLAVAMLTSLSIYAGVGCVVDVEAKLGFQAPLVVWSPEGNGGKLEGVS